MCIKRSFVGARTPPPPKPPAHRRRSVRAAPGPGSGSLSAHAGRRSLGRTAGAGAQPCRGPRAPQSPVGPPKALSCNFSPLLGSLWQGTTVFSLFFSFPISEGRSFPQQLCLFTAPAGKAGCAPAPAELSSRLAPLRATRDSQPCGPLTVCHAGGPEGGRTQSHRAGEPCVLWSPLPRQTDRQTSTSPLSRADRPHLQVPLKYGCPCFRHKRTDSPVGSPASPSEVVPKHGTANLAENSHTPHFHIWQTVPCSKELFGRNPLTFLIVFYRDEGKVWDMKEKADVFLKLFLFRKTLSVLGSAFIPTRASPPLSKIKPSRRGLLCSVKTQKLNHCCLALT